MQYSDPAIAKSHEMNGPPKDKHLMPLTIFLLWFAKSLNLHKTAQLGLCLSSQMSMSQTFEKWHWVYYDMDVSTKVHGTQQLLSHLNV